MDHIATTAWYTVAALGLTAVAVFCLGAYSFTQWLTSMFTDAFFKHMIYSSRGLAKICRRQASWRDVFFAILFISANGVCVGLGTSSVEELSRRTASLLATNLILSLPGASVAADTLRISLRSYHKVHYLIGVVALTEGSLHAILELSRQDWKPTMVSLSGVAVSSASLSDQIKELKTCRDTHASV